QWLLWAMLAVLCWGLWAITSKLIGNALSAGQSQALSTIGLVPIIAILAFTKSKTSESNRRRGIIIGFLSGVLVCLGNIAYYHALNLGGKAATVVSITALYPLITALLAMLLLKERLNEFQIFGIGLSIASMVIFNIYSTEGWASGWLVYAMIPVVLWGVGGLLQKISTNHISGELSTLWFLVAFVPVAFVLLIAEPLKHPIEMRVWMLASALG